jgi:hypothetical protein
MDVKLKVRKASKDEFANLVCPFCKKELTEIIMKPIQLKLQTNALDKMFRIGPEDGAAYFCLNVSHF